MRSLFLFFIILLLGFQGCSTKQIDTPVQEKEKTNTQKKLFLLLMRVKCKMSQILKMNLKMKRKLS